MFGIQYFLSSAIIKNVLAVCLVIGGGVGGYYTVKYVKKEYDRIQYEREIRRNYEDRQKMHKLDSLHINAN